MSVHWHSSHKSELHALSSACDEIRTGVSGTVLSTASVDLSRFFFFSIISMASSLIDCIYGQQWIIPLMSM